MKPRFALDAFNRQWATDSAAKGPANVRALQRRRLIVETLTVLLVVVVVGGQTSLIWSMIFAFKKELFFTFLERCVPRRVGWSPRSYLNPSGF